MPQPVLYVPRHSFIVEDDKSLGEGIVCLCSLTPRSPATKRAIDCEWLLWSNTVPAPNTRTTSVHRGKHHIQPLANIGGTKYAGQRFIVIGWIAEKT
jgi:hypothetical protein